MLTPLVSVVIPVFNASDFILETLTSVSNQTYTNYEVIIVDDCSTDFTYQVCKEYCSNNPQNFRLFKTIKNFGCPGGPRNLGVLEAKGDFIAFLDADDIWHTKKLELQINVINTTNAKFVSSNLVKFRKSHDFNTKDVVSSRYLKNISYFSQLFNYQTPTSSVLVSKDLMREYPFREGLDFKAREDIDCWLRIHKTLKLSVKIKTPLLGYRVVDGQISGNKLLMVKRTFYCYKHTDGINYKLMNLVPLIATATHFCRAFFNKIFDRSI